MIKINRFGNRTISQFNRSDFDNEASAQARFQKFAKAYRSSLDQFVGQDGGLVSQLSWGERRRIMSVLRKATLVAGPGQKSRIGRLGGGAAIGAVLAGFTVPAMAQYTAGGGSATAAGAVAIGTGATVANINGVATGTNNASTGNGAIAVGNNNSVDTFAAPNTITDNGILDRATGGTFNFPNGAPSQQGAGIALGQSNLVDAAGIAIGSNNQANHATNVTLAIGLGNQTSGAYGSAIGVGNLASGSSSLAVGVANVASNNTAIAMGRQSTASGQTSIAVGNVATASQTNAIAIGHSTQATATGAIAIGGGNNGASTSLDATAARASGGNAVAIGTGAATSALDTVAIGRGATIDSNSLATVAIGTGTTTNAAQNAVLIGTNAIAGTGTPASGNSQISIGNSANAQRGGAIGVGNLASARGNNSIALGTSANSGQQNGQSGGNIAIGNLANAANSAANVATDVNQIAIGTSANASAASAIAIGQSSNSTGANSTAVGPNAQASGVSSSAFGATATAVADNSTAIGMGSTTAAAATNAFAAGRTAAASGASSVAIGHDVVASAADTVVIGHSSSAVGPGSVSIGLGQVSTGEGAVAIGDPNVANGQGALAVGRNNTAAGNLAGTTAASGAVALGNTNRAIGQGAVAIGRTSDALAAGAVAIGDTAVAGQAGAVALGSGSVTAAAHVGAFTINGGAVAAASTAATRTVSVGAAGSERQIQNVAAGVVSATSTDAVTGSQLFVAATAANNLGATMETITGGGTVIAADGTLTTAPTITVGGVPYNNVTAAVEANDAKATNIGAGLASSLGGGAAVAADGTVTKPNYTLGGTNYGDVGAALAALDGGNTGIVRQVGGTPGAGQITVGAQTGGTSVSVAGTAGNRAVTGVLAGALTAASTDAVNGAQVSTLGTSIATSAGGGSTFDPLTGTVTAPSYTVAGGTQTNTGAALDALDDANALSNTGISSAIGGGMAIAANGTVTAPSVTVGTTNYSNLTDAIEAAGAGFNLTTAATGTGVANGTTVEGIAAGETVTLTAGNNIVMTQVGNETQVALNPALTGITSLAVTGGPLISGAGINMNGDGITGLAAGSTAAGSTDAINGSQINTALSSVATDLGGGATYNPVTGVVTAPGYAIDGTTYSNVGAALAALAADSKFVDFNSALAAADATGTNASAIGPNAQAVGNESTALGANSIASGTNSVALGANSQAGAANAGWAGTTFAGVTQSNNVNANGVVSVSGGTTNRQITGVADGAVNATSTDAISGSQLFNTATALDAKATNLGSGLASSLGGGAAVAADGTVTNPTISVGGTAYNNVTAAIQASDAKDNFANAGLAAALGGGAAISPDGTVTAPTYALSGTTYDNVGDALAAIDNGEVGLVKQVGSAPGAGDLTVGADTGGTVVNFAGTAGDRVLTGVAVGSTSATSTDAVNGSQLNLQAASVAAHLGGGATYNPTTGVVTTPNYVIAGTTYNDVGSALGSLAAGGAKQKYFNANSTLVDSTAVGVNSVAIGPNAVSTNAGDVALGNGAISAAPNTGAFTLNGGTVTATAPTSVLSIGAAGTERQIQNVAAGVVSATSTDAINGSQLFTVATAANNLGDSLETVTGGGLTLNPDGTIATPAAISVGGVTYANTSDAIEAGDGKADLANAGLADALGGGAAVGPDGTVTAPSYLLGGTPYDTVGAALAALDSGATGIVRQVGGAPGAGQITVGAQTGGTSVSVAGTDGSRTVTGVLAGALTAASTDAVNGSQLNTALASVATNTGGGSAFDPLTGTVTAPSISVGGTNFANVTAAIEAADDKMDAGLADTAAALGGGAVYDPVTGGITNPTYSVQGTNYTNVGDAISGVDSEVSDLKSGAAGLLQYSNAGAGRATPNGGTASQNMTLVGAGAGIPVQLSNVAGGEVSATSSDAVNGAQLFALGTALGGGSTFGPNGTVIPPSYVINGDTYANAGDAFGAINGAITGGGIKYFHANSTQSDSAPVGIDSIAIGPVSGAAGDRSISIGMNANASGSQSIAIGVGNVVSGTNSGAIGDPNTVTGNESYALGNNNVIAANNAFAVGNGITIAAGSDGSVGIGNGTTVSAPNAGTKSLNGGSIAATSPTSVVSVGAAGAERQVTNVAAGVVSATSTDAVNGSQLFAVGSAVNHQGTGLAAALGGGAAVSPDGTVTAPSYSVQGSTVNNVGAALSSLDGAVSGLTNGTSGLVKQTGGSPGSGAVTVGAATGGTVVSVAGTEGNRRVTGVANGSLAAGSTDAVNGGQLTAATAAGAAKSDAIGASVAANLGGGSAYNPATGAVSSPSYSVGGQSYGNVGAAVAATNMLAVQYVADSAGAPTNAVRLTGNGNGQPVGISNVAAGAVTATSTDAVNGGQLHGVQQTANGALQRTGGTLSGNLALGGNRVTGLAGPVDMADAATKGYVDTLQGQTNVQLQSLTSGLNGAFNRIERNSQGVALAIAMGGGFLSDDKKFSLWGAWGNFDGYNALAAQTYIRLSDDVILNGGMSFGLEENLVGTRVGIGIQF